MTDYIELDAVMAVADLVGRTGAKGFEIGYLDDNPINPRWYAHAQFNGARITCEEQPTPEAAADGLAHKLLKGGRCTGCQKIVGDGCRWRRDGQSWVRGCDGKRKATKRGS